MGLRFPKATSLTALGFWIPSDFPALPCGLPLSLSEPDGTPRAAVTLHPVPSAAPGWQFATLPTPIEVEADAHLFLCAEIAEDVPWFHEYTVLKHTSVAEVTGPVYQYAPDTPRMHVPHPDIGFGPLSFQWQAADDDPRHAIAANAWRERPLQAFQPRLNFGRHLEPKDRVLHIVGQSRPAFVNYREALPDLPISHYMLYCGLQNYPQGRLQQISAAYRDDPAPARMQLGLSMTYDGNPERCYAKAIAEGTLDDAVHRCATDLAVVGDGALIRLGYEFNGPWNGYAPSDFVAAWRRVVAIFREHPLNVAFVWCGSADASLEAFDAFYPGDDWVDWWGIDLFSAHHFGLPQVEAFMQDARDRRYPVLIGETSARYIGTADADAAWRLWFTPYLDFIHRHPHVKGSSFINWDWTQTRWPWGDARIERNPRLQERYHQAVKAWV